MDLDDQHMADHPVSLLLDACSPVTSVPPEQDPINAAARLHLLGESMCLIGHHLQETTVSVENRVAHLIFNQF